MPYLAFNLNDGNEFVFDILEERLTIGRDSSNDIVIDNTFISGFHAEFIRQSDGGYEIVDLKSSNGTFVNGKRVERARVKGGDRLTFGQLESRFRERAPKGLAPDGGSKSVAALKGQPSRIDGKKGDTESIPARDKTDESKQPAEETGRIEVTKPVVQRAPTDASKPIAVAPPAMFIPKPSGASTQPLPAPSLTPQPSEQRAELESLRRQLDALRTENEGALRHRDEALTLDGTLEARRKESQQAQEELARLKAELEAARSQAQSAKIELQHIKDETNKLDAKRRELGNLESKLESTRTLVAKAEGDLSTAQKSLQSLHDEADQQRKDRETSAAKVQAEVLAASEKLAQLQQSLATVERQAPQATLASPDTGRADAAARAQEMAEVDAKLQERKASLAQVEARLAKLTEEEKNTAGRVELLQGQQQSLSALAQKIGQMEDQRTALDVAVAALLTRQKTSATDAEAAQQRLETLRLELTGFESQRAAAEQACAAAKSRQTEVETALASQTQAAQARLAELEKQEHEARALAETRQQEAIKRHSDLQAQISQRESRLAEVQTQVTGLESKVADLNNKLEDLASTDSRLHDSNEALKALESHKAEVAAAVAVIVKDRDERTRELLAATEKGRAQALLTETLSKRREEAEQKTRLAEEQLADVSQATAKARELLRQAEDELKEREAQLAAADQRAKNLQELAATADQQFKATQAEHKKLTEQAALARENVDQLTQTAAERTREAAAQAAAVEKNLQQLATQAEKIAGLEAIIATLTAAHTATQQNLSTAEVEHQSLQERVATRQKEIVVGEARVAELTQQAAGLEQRVKELTDMGRQHAEVKGTLATATQERDRLLTENQRLAKERADLETLLPELRATATQARAEVDNLKAELASLAQERDAATTVLKESLVQRKEAEAAVQALQIESSNLDKILGDKRSNLEAETKVKLAEATAAETRLKGIQERITIAEKRLLELADVEARIASTTQTWRDVERQRQTEEKALADLLREQERLRKEWVTVEAGLRNINAQLAEATRNVKAAETKAAEAEKRAERALAAQQEADKRRTECEAALDTARSEERTLRKQIPALTSELAGIQTMLIGLTKEREEASHFVTRLNVTTENQNKKLSELQQQISQLEEAYKVRSERVMKAQEDVDKESARLKAVQEQARAAEALLGDLEKDVKESKQKAESARRDAAALEGELRERLDRVQNLKLEEERLSKSVQSHGLDLNAAGLQLKDLQEKISARQTELGDYLKVGGQIMGLGQALASLESRQAEINKSLRRSAEEELAIQVKLSAAQESMNRETARAEQARRDRESAEAEFKNFTASIQAQAATLQHYEVEQKKRIAELEKRIADLGAIEQRALGRVQDADAELKRLEGLKREFAQAEAQLKHWQEIERRLRGQLEELEEKHEVMRRGLPSDEGTVVMFANDLIKRIDLIDALVSRYVGVNGSGGADVAGQLRTLRASFEDILHQHGVTEFDIAPGTEVDLELRKRIAVVDSLPGKAKPRVTECCRSGFIYSRGEGHEIILRKVEVRTSSQ